MFERLQASLSIRRYRWQTLPCPTCGCTHGETLLTRDRYLLRVDIKACAECGLIYTGRNLDSASLTRFYRNEYRRFYEDIDSITPQYVYDTRDKLKGSYRLARIREQVGQITGAVEIGCGLGFFMHECIQSGIDNIIGFEPGKLFADYAANQLKLADKVVNTDCLGYTGSLPDANVYALFHVLEHLPDPGTLLDWVAARIGTGWLVIEVPDITHGWEWLGLRNFHFGHCSYFTPDTLNQLLRRHGFGIGAFHSAIDDGIYPGNLRVFARRLDTPGVQFVTPPPPDNQTIRQKVRSTGQAGRQTLRGAARLLRP